MNGTRLEISSRGRRASFPKTENPKKLTYSCNASDLLAPFKTQPTISVDWYFDKRKSLSYSSCSKCIPTSQALYSEDPLSTLGMANMLRVPTQNRDKNIITRLFYYVSFVMSRKTDTNYVNVSAEIIRSSKVKQAVEMAVRQDLMDIAAKRGQLSDENKIAASLQKKHSKRARELYHKMKSCISSGLLRLAGWILYKLLNQMLSSIQYSKGQLSTIRRVQQDTKLPLIYLPVHRSHLDYILLSFILYMNNIKPPLVAAGDNLNIPFFGNLMRGLGAFFIKRKLDPTSEKKDHVYRALLDAYMTENLRRGESLEFFIEGGRSRSGKACLPKTGLLSIIVNSMVEGHIKDAYIVPVGISYEKLIDGNFVSEQLGKPKVTESFSGAAKAIWSTLRSNFGSVRVEFSKPFSLKEYVEKSSNYLYEKSLTNGHILPVHDKMHANDKDCQASRLCAACSANLPSLRTISSSASLYGTDVNVEDEVRKTIQVLGEHVLYDASNCVPLMSTQMLSFLLLTKFRKGVTLRQLVPEMDWLRQEVERRDRRVGFSGESSEVIRYACTLLGRNLVSTETVQMAWSSSSELREDTNTNRVKKIVLLKPSLKLHSAIELQYYSNTVVTLFLLDSIIANAFFSRWGMELETLEPSDKVKLTMTREDLIKVVLELCNMLKYEFLICKPCQEMEAAFSDTIDGMIASGLLTSKTQQSMDHIKSLGFDDDDGFSGGNAVQVTEDLTLHFSIENLELLRFHRSILGPFIESYWLAASHLLTLIKKQSEYNLFTENMLTSAKDKLCQGLLCYPESVVMDQLKNALNLFENWKVIERKIAAGVTVVYLTRQFDNQDALNDVIMKIEKFKM
ncbi:Glycerol-3-phosphate acyltransferase 1, mitochondrial [Halotydeus destructor]|nr:Glycerol-3-phosphate acyltransferase 1, mitochondrial [Halotydeus destructor]